MNFLLSVIVLLFAYCSSVTSTSEIGASYFARPITETCGIIGCPADLSYPPCWNSTHIGEKGEPGERGDKGPLGDSGKDGLPGERGENGEKGNTGPRGEPGPKGEKGYKGEKGDVGDPGDDGRAFQGDPGEPGDVGAMGERGPRGLPGCAGDQGNQGATGVMGDKGPQGLVGERGPKGERGPIGDQGPLGRPGARGPTGLQGLKGDQGDIGPMGESGPPGNQGSLGPRGPKGPRPRIVNGKNLQGDQGDRGDTTQCHKIIEYQGEKGDKGDLGPQGKQGPKGRTGRRGQQGICKFSKINFQDIIFPPEKYGIRGVMGPRGRGIRGEQGTPGTCDDTFCPCLKNCREETELRYEECDYKYICGNQPPPPESEKQIAQGAEGPIGRKGDQGPPGFGLKGPDGPIGPAGDNYPEDRKCECCPECLRFADTDSYAVHSISPNAPVSCYDNDQELYKGHSLMHFASYSPSPTVSQDLGDIGSCIPDGEESKFSAVPFQSCSSSEDSCRFAERRPVVIWLSNSTDNIQGGPMLNATETAKRLSRCVACRGRGSLFFVNHTLSKEAPTCPDSSELWKTRYGGLARWQWKLRYTGLTWVMFQSNDVQGGNMLQSPGSCFPGEFSNTLFFECQGPDRCYNKFGEFKNYWMMNAEEANRRFYGMNTTMPTLTPGKSRREDVSPTESGILARCAVCELIPPECTKCRMPTNRMHAKQAKLQTWTNTYVVHSQKVGGDDVIPKCKHAVTADEENKPLWTGYSLMQQRGATATDLGETSSCVANFAQGNVNLEDGSTTSVWLAGRELVTEDETDMTDVVGRCAVCTSRYPIVVVHGSADDTESKPPSCPGLDDVALWTGYSLLSISQQQSRQQTTLSTSTGSCLRDITVRTCAVECRHDDATNKTSCKASTSHICNWSLRNNHPTVDDVLKKGRLSDNKGDAYVYDWAQYMGRCTVCAIRSSAEM